IMVTTEGTVKVVDFGIARLVDTSKTQTGMLLGTLGYMLADAAKPASTLVDLAREYVYERGAGAQSASRETQNKPEFTAKPQRVATLDRPARIRSSPPGASRSPAAAGERPDAGGERQAGIPQPDLVAQATERPWWKQPLPITSMVLALNLGVASGGFHH